MKTLEDVAVKVVTNYGISAGPTEVFYTLNDAGFADPDGELNTRVMEMVKTAVVRVRVRFA